MQEPGFPVRMVDCFFTDYYTSFIQTFKSAGSAGFLILRGHKMRSVFGKPFFQKTAVPLAVLVTLGLFLGGCPQPGGG
jgi:hypothetical protein